MKPTRFILAGEKTDSTERLEVRSPYDGKVVGETFLASKAQAEEAARQAKAAFAISRKMPAHQKARILLNVSRMLEERKEEIARIMCAESAKPIRDCRLEVGRSMHIFFIAAEEARRLGGEIIPLDLTPGNEGRMGFLRRFPIGPVLGITPFNFPLNQVAHKLAPAIAAGNPVIIKPATRTPLTALRLGEWVLEAGLPPQLLSVLPCSNEVAEGLVTNENIAMLTFTGSDVVGWKLKALAGKRRVTLELGGNAAVIIHSDADIADAVSRCVRGGYYYAGQSCISVQRIYLHRPIAKAFLESFVEKVKALKLGDPQEETTDVGPVIEQAAAERIEKKIQAALAGGAKLLCGGKRDGVMIAPAVLVGVKPDMEVVCTEVFAPLVVVEEYDEFEEALERANATRFGLQASVFTRDIGRIHRAFETLEAGGVIVNEVTNWRVDNMPYGGMKDSGQGREGPKYAIEEMTEPRLLVLAQM